MRRYKGPGTLCPNCGRINDYGERCECEKLEAENVVRDQIHRRLKRTAAACSAMENRIEQAYAEWLYS